LLRRIKKLITHPGFRAEPVAVLARAAAWGTCVLGGYQPVFKLTEAGEKLRVPTDMRYTSLATFLLRDWSEPELRYLQLFVRLEDVFVDIGANIGLFTLKAAGLVGPKGQVIAVEPGLAASQLLTANLSLNNFPNVRQIRMALSDSIGEATLHHVNVGDDPQAFSLLADDTESGGEKVPTTTLDAVADELGLSRIDCIKIDVEGAEEKVIAGAHATLDRWRPTVIFEANCPTLVRQGVPADGAWKQLNEHGYEFYLLTENGTLSALSRMPEDFCNIIAHHPQQLHRRTN
jgi:FkbM family methyltransferase